MTFKIIFGSVERFKFSLMAATEISTAVSFGKQNNPIEILQSTMLYNWQFFSSFKQNDNRISAVHGLSLWLNQNNLTVLIQNLFNGKIIPWDIFVLLVGFSCTFSSINMVHSSQNCKPVAEWIELSMQAWQRRNQPRFWLMATFTMVYTF